jgi:hypothetical protein
MVDVVGYRPQRNKWLNCIDNINSIIFCASLNDYGKAISYKSYHIDSYGHHAKHHIFVTVEMRPLP